MACVMFLSGVEGDSGWLNYPGFEVWKFFNLFLFIGAAIYIHHRFGKPIAQALRARSERIRFELETARREYNEAQVRMAELDAQLRDLDVEIARIRAEAVAEVEGERERIIRATELEIGKLGQQAQREIAIATKVAQTELRQFAASRSVELAEGLIEQDISATDDLRLMLTSVDELGSSRI